MVGLLFFYASGQMHAGMRHLPKARTAALQGRRVRSDSACLTGASTGIRIETNLDTCVLQQSMSHVANRASASKMIRVWSHKAALEGWAVTPPRSGL